MSSLFEELKRRNVIRMAVFYVVASWLILQVAELLFDAMDLPNQWLRLVLALLILGLPLVLIFSWVFELTPEGVKREKDVDRGRSITPHTGRRINTLIIVLLILAIAAVGVDRLLPEPVPETSPVTAETTAPADAAAPAQSIAVLPFADLSSTGDQEYFSDGIAEEILNVLVRIEGLKVASRTTSWGFKGQEALGIPFMAEKMNVRHVLEGSVRKAGDTVRITAQLIDAQTDQHLWSQTFDRQLTAESIFDIQDEIAAAIVEQLGGIIDPVAVSARSSADTGSLDAYELYLEARQLFVERRSLERSITLFEKAVSLDPGFARAWAGLAAVSSVAADWGIIDRDLDKLSYDAANTAISLNPDLALPHAVLGNDATRHQSPPDYRLAIEFYGKALSLDNKVSSTYLWRAIRYMDLGYFDRAEQDLLACLEIDPAYENCRSHLAMIALYAGNTDRALELVEQCFRNGFIGNFLPFIYVYAERGQFAVVAAAIASYNEPVKVSGATNFQYRAVIDPSFDYDTERSQIEAAFVVPGESESSWPPGLFDYWFAFREYEKVEGNYYSYWWFPYPKEFRNSPHRKRLIREMGLPDFWREHGFPSQCRPVGDDDFECD